MPNRSRDSGEGDGGCFVFRVVERHRGILEQSAIEQRHASVRVCLHRILDHLDSARGAADDHFPGR